jgi:ATP-dependent DNA helicase PIF1
MVELSVEQAAGLRRVRDERGSNFFITGDAGHGKSVLATAIIEELRGRKDAVVHIAAFMGIAAAEVGGTTLNRFAWIAPGFEKEPLDIIQAKANEMADYKVFMYRKLREKLEQATHLLIDEISTVHPDMMTLLHIYISTIREWRYGHLPFGGLQVIVCGDFHQIPPVVKNSPWNIKEGQTFRDVDTLSKKEKEEQERFMRDVKLFAFQSDIWPRLQFKWINLTQNFRQENDTSFYNLLAHARRGQLTPAMIATLQERTRVPKPDLYNTDINAVPVLAIYPHNTNVDATNYKRLHSLPGEIHTFKTVDECRDPKNQKLLNDLRVAAKIELKIGCQVMLFANLPLYGDDAILANGAMGKVTGFGHVSEGGYPHVLFAATKHRPAVTRYMKPHEWPLRETASGPVVASRTQVPLALAYAITAHKSQGQTITCPVIMDLGAAFGPGMAYVMLSRVRSLDQVFLTSFKPSAIITHPAVSAFYATHETPLVNTDVVFQAPQIPQLSPANVDDDDDDGSSPKRQREDREDEEEKRPHKKQRPLMDDEDDVFNF